MVNVIARVALVSWLCAGGLKAALLLTPTLDEFELDSTKLTQLAFRDGDVKVTYQPPRSWQYNGSANQLTLRPAGKTQAEAIITTAPLAAPVTLDGGSLKKLEAEIVAALPKGSENVRIVSEERNPVTIGRKETVLIILKYVFCGEAYARSVLVLNRPAEQLRFQLTCRQPDFDQLHKAFFASQFTWQNL